MASNKELPQDVLVDSVREVRINAGKAVISGTLAIPEGAQGIVIFAHGSGSGRFSPRNRYVAEILNKSNIATLLIDLLTQAEEEQDVYTGEYRFNIRLLADRLMASTNFVTQDASTKQLHVGYFGASTGAAAALVAAAALPDIVLAVVSRGGRPDLAGEALRGVTAATLLIVGGRDLQVIDLNEQALAKLTNAKAKDLVIIPEATHLFEEQGALEEVSRYAKDWFAKYM